MTQAEFARRLGVSRSLITEYISGRRSIPDKTLRLISHTFGVSYEWLKYGRGEMWEKKEEDEVEVLAKMILARARREGKEMCMDQARKLAKKYLKMMDLEIDMLGEEDMAG